VVRLEISAKVIMPLEIHDGLTKGQARLPLAFQNLPYLQHFANQ
jgi:hypothetical protein